MDIRMFGLVDESIVDGPGFRMAIFVQGCPHHCPGCHNPGSHAFDGGTIMDTDDIVKQAIENPLLDGITLSGGEPFCQPVPCAEIARQVRAHGLNVWSYTGYTFEQLMEGTPEQKALLEQLDVLVDGRFELEKRTLELRFRGSSNQRLIDVPKSLAQGCVVEYPLK